MADTDQPRKPPGRLTVAETVSKLVTYALAPQRTHAEIVARLRLVADRLEATTKVSAEPAKRPSKPPSEQVQAIFEFWQSTMEHPVAQLTPNRRKKIEARLAQGYSADMLRNAILGCSRTPFNMGLDPKHLGEMHDDLTVCLATGEKVEMYAQRANASPLARQTATAKATDYDPRVHGDLGHMGGEYRAKWNLYVDVGPAAYESEWAKRSGA